MTDESPEKLAITSLDIVADRRARLRELFPEVFREDKIDFAALERSLGEWIEPGKERYGLNWPGKAECMRIIQMPSIGTLRPRRDQSVNFDATDNLIIEGDNLEVLKLLQKSYYGKVKMIYIDPPYNTGKEFIYPDNYREGLRDYLKYSGQVDAEGMKVSANTETSGRYHSKWLSMMYPRLYLARNLLRDDGVIFVSIDDHEVDNLRRLCAEVFGEENFIGLITWRARNFADARPMRGLSVDHEYVAIWGKGGEARITGKQRDERKYSNPDNDPRGPWTSCSLLGKATREQRPNLHYDIVHPDTHEVFPAPPETGWICRPETLEKKIEERRILWPRKPGGRPREKVFLQELQSGVLGFPSVLDGIFTSDGTEEMRDLFQEQVFPFPKPSLLIRNLLLQGMEADGIVLDFFAGSGTTAHAALDLNSEDGGKRQFILVQLPEKTEHPQYPTIADICRERVRRVIQKIDAEDEAKDSLGLEKRPPRGFKALQLTSSNFHVWDGDAEKIKNVEDQLKLFAQHVEPGRPDEDLLYEILLKAGFTIDSHIEPLSLAGKVVFSVAEGALLLCLDRELTLDVIEAMVNREPTPSQIICLDAGFQGNDQLKVNAVQTVKARNRLKEGDLVFQVV